MHDNEHICVLGHLVEDGGELGELHLERVELLAHARTRVLERLDQLRRALVPRRLEPVRVAAALMGHDRCLCAEALRLRLWRGGRGRVDRL